MMKMKKINTVKLWAFMGLLSLVVSGCGSVSTGQQYFVLNNSNQADISMIAGEPKISIRRVKLPDYLNQRTMVRRLENDQIKPLPNQFWAETLSQAIPTVLAQELSVNLREPVEVHPLPPGITVDTIIEVEVTEFLGNSSVLDFQTAYRMVKPKKLETRNFSTNVKLANDSTLALVDGYQEALKRLAADIAKHL